MADHYFQKALENERDLNSVANKGPSTGGVGAGTGMRAQSGFAKMIDREPLEGNLYNLADDLETFAKKVFDRVAKLLNVENDGKVTFDRDFDLQSYDQKLADIKTAIDVQLGQVSPKALEIAYKSIIPEITSDPDEQQQVNDEIEANVPIVFSELAQAQKMMDKMKPGFGGKGKGGMNSGTSASGSVAGMDVGAKK
jgi:hypothetical protein